MLGVFSAMPAIFLKDNLFRRIEFVFSRDVISVFTQRADESKNYSMFSFCHIPSPLLPAAQALFTACMNNAEKL